MTRAALLKFKMRVAVSNALLAWSNLNHDIAWHMRELAWRIRRGAK